MTSPYQKRQDMHRERALTVVSQAMVEGRPLKDLVPELGCSYKTILRYRDLLMKRTTENNDLTIDDYRQAQLLELAELKEKLESPNIKDDRKVELALSIIDREIKLLGTAAPEKLQVTGPQLNPTYLAIAKAMADVAEEDQIKVLEFAKTLVRPLELTADCFPALTVPQLTEGEPDDLVR
jgi:hypothetical protein